MFKKVLISPMPFGIRVVAMIYQEGRDTCHQKETNIRLDVEMKVLLQTESAAAEIMDSRFILLIGVTLQVILAWP